MLKSWFSAPRGEAKDEHDRSSSKHGYLFPTVTPQDDGPDCLRDCADCTVHYPIKFHINGDRKLYGNVKPFTTHVLVATGRSDWPEKVERQKGSLMEALHDTPVKSRDGRMMVSASNFRAPQDESTSDDDGQTTVLLLPSFTFVDHVTNRDIPELVTRFVDAGGDSSSDADPGSSLTSRPCQHDYVVLLCSHKRRDARCGISAPLIKRELERHLRPAGLYRDVDDERPGGVGIYFVSHVGGHKFSANMLVYRKQDAQLIWLARVRPEHCEGIVKYTILQGKVVHPESQLRGGFDRTRGLTSW